MRQSPAFNMTYREIVSYLLILRWFLTKRLICYIKRCDLRYEYEQQYLVEVWCVRCGNYHNNAGMGKLDKKLFMRRKIR